MTAKIEVLDMHEPVESRERQDSLISATENRAMFDNIAGYYDCTNKILSFGLDYRWRRFAVARLAP